jgi:hypothetical protein
MDWYSLGHAMWLARAKGLRFLFDPLLTDIHHGGVFEVFPPREVHAEALRPDFLVISHRHPDHFDIPSLRVLAKLDPETVVVTPDALIEEVARAVGFRTVHRVDAGVRVDLDGVRIVTTPAAGSALEWGLVVECGGLTVWNQVDTAQGGPEGVRRTLRAAGEALGVGELRPDLALVRWQPLKEVDAVLARDLGFPFNEYATVIEEGAALGARALVPSAAGAVHRGPYAFMNRHVHPVPEARFLRDMGVRCPDVRLFSNSTGARYRVEPDNIVMEEGAGKAFVSVVSHGPDPRVFRPFELPAVCDVDNGRGQERNRQSVRRWARGALLGALEAVDRRRTVRLLEVVYQDVTDVFTLTTGDGSASVTDEPTDDYDVCNVVAGSLLADVIEGRRHWGDLLLGGMLRASGRAYTVSPEGLRARKVAPIFLYHALSYDESIRRAVAWELAQGG